MKTEREYVLCQQSTVRTFAAPKVLIEYVGRNPIVPFWRAISRSSLSGEVHVKIELEWKQLND